MTVCVLIAYPCLAELFEVRGKGNGIGLVNKEVQTGIERLLLTGGEVFCVLR